MAKVTALVALLVAGCAASPVTVPLGDVTVRLEPDGARMVIARADGTAILDGTMIGFRTATATFMELYGSFNIDESAPAWQVARGFSKIVPRADGVSFDVEGGGHGEITRVADGVLQVVLSGSGVNRATAAFRCQPDEHFLGFGAQTADVDHRGQTVPIWVSEQGIGKVDTDDPPGDWFFRGTRHSSYFPVPFFLSSRNYGVRADTTRRSVFAMCSETPDAWRVEAWEGTLSFHLFYGASPLEVIARKSDLEGRAPVPPPFTFAPWNDAIQGSASVRQVAQVLRQNHIPSSVIWTEDWAGGAQAGDNYSLTYQWSVDRTLYPDVEQLASELHASGFKFLAYFNTFVESDAAHYQAAVDGGFVIHRPDGSPYLFDGARFTQTSLLDLTNPAAGDFLAGYLNSALDLGFDGWMADYGEWLPVDAKLASGEDAQAMHDQYPLLWQKLNDRVLGARTDGLDRLVFVRSGHNGSQPVGHQVVWGGDQSTEFAPDDGLPTVVPIGLGLGVAGLPYYGSDIAGYQTAPNHPTSTKELFFRWTELGALSPIMRTHHGVQPALEWSFQRDAETLAHYKRWATFHARLFPYLEAAATDASLTGAPLMRAVALGFPADEKTWGLKDQFLLGPAILVAPVLTGGAVSRTVYLPAGHWIPLLGGAPIDGPVSVDVDAPVTELPLFVRSGTVLVMLPDPIDTLAPASDATVVGLAQVGDGREVIAYLGADGDFVEAGGLAYHLTSAREPGGTPTASWNGAPVTIVAADRELSVQTIGDGTLQISDATGVVAQVTTAGGSSTRALTLRARW